MIPSSMTRLVDAISKAMAAVKLAPFRNSDRASATARRGGEARPGAACELDGDPPRAAHYLRCAWFYYGLSSPWKRHADVTSSPET